MTSNMMYDLHSNGKSPRANPGISLGRGAHHKNGSKRDANYVLIGNIGTWGGGAHPLHPIAGSAPGADPDCLTNEYSPVDSGTLI